MVWEGWSAALWVNDSIWVISENSVSSSDGCSDWSIQQSCSQSSSVVWINLFEISKSKWVFLSFLYTSSIFAKPLLPSVRIILGFKDSVSFGIPPSLLVPSAEAPKVIVSTRGCAVNDLLRRQAFGLGDVLQSLSWLESSSGSESVWRSTVFALVFDRAHNFRVRI